METKHHPGDKDCIGKMYDHEAVPNRNHGVVKALYRCPSGHVSFHVWTVDEFLNELKKAKNETTKIKS